MPKTIRDAHQFKAIQKKSIRDDLRRRIELIGHHKTQATLIARSIPECNIHHSFSMAKRKQSKPSRKFVLFGTKS